ncbi:MAG: ribosome maturation factor RimM [Corallococcus sp.]|nr:ribosome maturation factor RimM [Corallococcus sp.]MCM1359470.1 ribosome maturation factor RimM [Corallococcus sp.]MCM1394718.1 ribosome maturation factor RimM [Corallococcus sp.]
MKLLVGRILKAQGIKGELKISCLLDNAEMLKNTKKFYIGSNVYTAEKIRADGSVFYATFSEINDRNAAENYRGWEVYCDKEEVSLPNDRYFISDILGCKVTLSDGTQIGEIIDVLQYGAADVYVVKNATGEVSFPMLKDLIVSVNVQTKSIVLVAERFKEVSVVNEN